MYGRACGEHRVHQRWQPRHRVDESRVTAILGGMHESARTRARRLQRRQEHARYVSVRETLRQLTESDYCEWLRRQGTRVPQLDERGDSRRARPTLHESIVLFGVPAAAHWHGDAPSACAAGGSSTSTTSDAGPIVISCLEHHHHRIWRHV